MAIVQNDADRWRFMRSLYYLNDSFFDEEWDSLTSQVSLTNLREGLFPRPAHWPERRPLVKILCYILMPNHLHLLLRETQEGGIVTFMRKLGQSMTNHFNEKYESKGSLFQGGYKGRTIQTDSYMRYILAYIMVKNAFELFPGGLDKARISFEDAWKYALNFPFGSLTHYGAGQDSPIIDADVAKELFENPQTFKVFAKEVIEGRKWEKEKTYKHLLME